MKNVTMAVVVWLGLASLIVLHVVLSSNAYEYRLITDRDELTAILVDQHGGGWEPVGPPGGAWFRRPRFRLP